jgi:hypothetical protein
MDPDDSNTLWKASFFTEPHPLATAEPSATENPPTATSFSTAAAAEVLSEDCAVNVWGWGIQIPDCVDRNNITFLNAEYPVKYSGDFAHVYAERAKHGPPGRSPFSFTAQELNEHNAGRYILVGFALPLLGEKYRRPSPSQLAEAGVPDTNNDAMTLVPSVASGALVMVVALLSHVPQPAKLYGLLDGPSGLSLPYATNFKYWYVQIRAASSFWSFC